ncbi:response regulator transcription factor [Amycolatopsis sp. CA-230715]|uniref:response regulator transcription factor n=1 Tax=Amycolatopsis sp. CA-230715 TaxID=2745196 RepID=UPI001C028D0A|nr:response regulator transcription factor [Amycolatopsis sp. CA-230715]QWF84022.1 putative transcriptional regulatory protein TcrX [Amycolatopsis sp. CA-230715]
MTTASLLVVEDDPTLRDLLVASLRFAGFEVTATESGTEALRIVSNGPPDLVVLDVLLPDLDGFSVLRRMRAGTAPAREVPVLFLTARDAGDDKVAGLSAGGDDYVTKPFRLDELIARIRAILRRTAGATPEVLSAGDLVLDPAARLVTRGGEPISLSPTEFTLLRFLVENADRVLDRAQILHRVWHYDFGGDASIVESYISYLRRKVDNREPKLIHTVRGVGYVLRRPR